MERQQRLLIMLTFMLSLCAITVVVVSLATDHWVESTPQLTFSNTSTSTDPSHINFGLFKGYHSLNFGFSARVKNVEVFCGASQGVCVVYPDDEAITAKEYIDHVMSNRTEDEELWELGLFNYGYWVTSIVSAALSIVFGMISMGFAVFNICGKPIETITGPMGLYLWNGIAFIFVLLEFVMFLALFLTTLKKNFLLRAYIDTFNLEDTNLGFSFYLVVVAVVLYFINILLLFCSGYKLRCSFSSEAEKVVDSDMILY